MINFSYLFFVVSLISCAVSGKDGDLLARADELFEKRRISLQNVHEGKKLYLKLIKDTKLSLLTRKNALEKYARLSVWEGEVGRQYFGTSNKQAAKIFETCMQVTEHLSPKKLKGKQIAEYTYWRAMCIGLWGANANPAKVFLKINRIAELMSLTQYGQKNYPKFDGYGFDRIEAGINMRSKFLGRLGSYNPQKALDLINHSLSKGTDLYIIYSLKAEALILLDREDEARECLIEGIAELFDRLEKRDLPEVLREENIVFLEVLKDDLTALSKS